MSRTKEKITLIIIFLLGVFLRFYRLTSVPPSLYWEEAALGYDAYSILKTGKDLHGNLFPLVAFESFGDWKPSLYFYSTVPSIALFGLNEFSVRFPSAFFGSLTVLLVYFLVKELSILPIHQPRRLKNKPPRFSLALTASLLLAISPWHLQFSRPGFEANLASFLIVLGTWLFFKAVKANFNWLLISAVSFALSLYAYHAARVFVPLFVIALGVIFLKTLTKKKDIVILSLLLGLILISPIIIEFRKPAVQSRLQTTSAFATLEPVLESNQKIREDDDSLAARLIHHRFWHYTKIFFINYFDHFRPDFLFLKGDVNPRHSTQEHGLLYLIEAPFLAAGIYFIFRKKQWFLTPILLWLFLAPVPAGLTKATPHSLRLLVGIPSLQILTANGIINFYLIIKRRSKLNYIFSSLLFTLYSLLFIQYLHFYYRHYSQLYSQYWQYGYKEMINFVTENEDKYESIFISREHGRPSIYYFFFNQIDPKIVQLEDKQVLKDQGELLSFGKINFFLAPSEQIPTHSLIVAGGKEEVDAMLFKQINFLDGESAFKIYEK